MSQCVVCKEEIREGLVHNDDWCPLCRHLSFRGLPHHYLKAKREHFNGGREKLFEGHDSLFIHGKVGTGKTWLAAALMREQARSRERMDEHGNSIMYLDDARFISLPELAIEIRDTMGNSSSDSESKIISRYTKVKTLFLDDIGAEKVSDYIKSILFLIMERRNTMLGGRTVITSNLSLRELDKEHGARIASRISEMCRGGIVKMTGADRRISTNGEER